VRSLPVLLVHGFASSFERNWREPGWVDLLGDAGRETIEVDLLGHGNAPKPHDPAAYADLEAGVAEALPKDGQVDAIGFSLGARVLLGLAARHPERFGRLVAGGVGANLLTAADHEPVARAIEGLEAPTHPLAQAFTRFAQTPGNDPAALAAVMRRPELPLSPEQLARVTCPVLVVLGDRDFVGPADALVELLPDATLTVLRGVDHLGTPGDFGFIDAALRFIDAVPA
jgi:pimeloyl-ACP methyl ester carboxylesterase